jgi:hypothetical protein
VKVSECGVTETKNRRHATQEELDYNDTIEAELDEWDNMIHNIQVGHIPGGWPEGWNPDMEMVYQGYPKTITEGDTGSTPEEWKEFLKRLEEDLGK